VRTIDEHTAVLWVFLHNQGYDFVCLQIFAVAG
jgi:hypothetical protein